MNSSTQLHRNFPDNRTTRRPGTWTAFPRDDHAVIHAPAGSPMSSGKARPGRWKLTFERRTPPWIDPLMGWTGGDDTLSQVELTFTSADAAIGYARRQGLPYTVHGLPSGPPALRLVTKADDRQHAAHQGRLEWVKRTLWEDAQLESIRAGTVPGPLCTEWHDVLDESSKVA